MRLRCTPCAADGAGAGHPKCLPEPSCGCCCSPRVLGLQLHSAGRDEAGLRLPATGQSPLALGLCRAGMGVTQALCPGTGRRPCQVPGTTPLPSSQTICSPACSCSVMQAVERSHHAAARPPCAPGSTQTRQVLGANMARGCSLEASCLGEANASCRCFAGVRPLPRPCCAGLGMPVAAVGGGRSHGASTRQGARCGQGVPQPILVQEPA